MAKQMNVNMQLLDLEMRVLARMIRILLYERRCKKCPPCKRPSNVILPLLQNETETFYEKLKILKILDKWRMIYINTNVSCVFQLSIHANILEG